MSKKPYPPKKTQERIEEAQTWTYFIARGEKFNRIQVGREIPPIDIVDGRCYNCLSPEKSFHCLGCSEEFLECCGRLALNCNCEFESEE